MLARVTALPRAAAPVPDADALRRTALAASWRRDRQVGRRRLAWRTLLWFSARFALPLAALLAFGYIVWHFQTRPRGDAAPTAVTPPGPTKVTREDATSAPAPGLALRLDLSAILPATADPGADPTAEPRPDPTPARRSTEQGSQAP